MRHLIWLAVAIGFTQSVPLAIAQSDSGTKAGAYNAGPIGAPPPGFSPRRFLVLKVVRETAVFGESRWGEALFGGDADGDRYEQLLALLSSGGFPKPGQRDTSPKDRSTRNGTP